MKPSLTLRLHHWWAARRARRHRLEQVRMIEALPADIRSDIARASLAQAFDEDAEFRLPN